MTIIHYVYCSGLKNGVIIIIKTPQLRERLNKRWADLWGSFL